MPVPVIDRRSGSSPIRTLGAATVRTPDDFLSGVQLRRGLCGDAVQLWQEWLNALARILPTPTVSEDGRFGSETTAATIAVQRALGVKGDGIVGPVTRRAAFVRLSAQAPGFRPYPRPSATALPCPRPTAAPAPGEPLAPLPETDRSFLDVVADNPIISISVGALVVLAVAKAKKR